MSVQSEIDRIITAVGNAYSKVSEKGGTVPSSQTVANLATAIDSIPSGGAKETWVIKSDAAGELVTTQIAFTSNGQKFTSIGTNSGDGYLIVLRYDNNDVAVYSIAGVGSGFEFKNDAYRKLTFDTHPTGALLTWLQSNGIKQPDDTAVQDTKALTIASNGTISVIPDEPYDALKNAEVTVNVASGGGSVETCTLTTSVNKTGHGIIYACSGDTLIEITSAGTYSINKNSIVAITRTGGRDSYTGLEELKFDGSIRVCFVTSNIATYNYKS